MKNRKLLLVVSLVLALTMSLGGTLAYLTDTDEAVNVMTLGNVKIDQLENGVSEGGFANGQPLYPAYYEGDNWKAAGENTGSLKKEVNVKNVGSSDAFIRTLFAIEKGELTEDEFAKYIHLEWAEGIEAQLKWVTEIDVKGAKYKVAVYTYPAAVKGGAEAGMTLKRVVMDKEANNDIVSKLGNTYEILVLSQAVQVNNLETLGSEGALNEAFGEVSKNAAEWFGGIYENGGLPTTVVATAAELEAALEKGGNVLVSANIELENAIEIPTGVTAVVNLNGKNLSSSDYVFENYGDLTITGKGQLGGLGGIRSHSGSVTINGGTFSGSSDWNEGTYQHILKAENTTVVINDGDFDATIMGMTNAMINVSNGSNVTINGGTFENVAGDLATFDPYMFTYEGDGKLTINGGDFYGGWRFNGTSATTDIYGGNFEVSYDGQSFNASSTHVLTVYGGTFSNKLGNRISQHVAEGSVANENNGTWTVTRVATVVDNATDLVAALEKGENVLVKANIELSEAVKVPAGVTLNLDGVKIDGTVEALGDLTIVGDAEIKTLKAVNGGTITVEENLALNNFSFGSEKTADAEYEITGGKITANYGFFQHGTYDLHADFETGYMYYSYGSDITVYGTFHSQGTGDGLDYVRGNLTIANGGKSIHEKSLWVGQPASWGAMNASLTVEEGGYVQANSLSVYDGSKLVIDAVAGEVTSVVCNTLTNEGTIEAANNSLTAEVQGNKIVLE